MLNSGRPQIDGQNSVVCIRVRTAPHSVEQDISHEDYILGTEWAPLPPGGGLFALGLVISVVRRRGMRHWRLRFNFCDNITFFAPRDSALKAMRRRSVLSLQCGTRLATVTKSQSGKILPEVFVTAAKATLSCFACLRLLV